MSEEEDPINPIPYNIEAITTTLALEKLSKQNFKSENYENQKIFHIKIKIEDKVDENLNEASFAHCLDVSTPVLIAFKSEKEVKIIWKTSTCGKFYFLNFCVLLNKIEFDFCEQFLISEIIENKNGKCKRKLPLCCV